MRKARRATGQPERTGQLVLYDVAYGAYGLSVRMSETLAAKMTRSGTLPTGEKQERRGLKEQLSLLL